MPALRSEASDRATPSAIQIMVRLFYSIFLGCPPARYAGLAGHDRNRIGAVLICSGYLCDRSVMFARQRITRLRGSGMGFERMLRGALLMFVTAGDGGRDRTHAVEVLAFAGGERLSCSARL